MKLTTLAHVAALLFLVGQSVPAMAAPTTTWTDGNGIQWIAESVKTTFDLARTRCEEQKFSLPDTETLQEALDLGLGDASVNTIFGAQVATMDWFWSGSDTPYLSDIRDIVSLQGDTTPAFTDERHWAVCALKATK